MADQHAHLKQWRQAISLADRATALYREVVEQNPSMVKFAKELYDAFNDGARLAEASRDVNAAEAHRLEADNFWRTHPAIDRQGK